MMGDDRHPGLRVVLCCCCGAWAVCLTGCAVGWGTGCDAAGVAAGVAGRVAGTQPFASQSGLRVELRYDYDDIIVAETFDYDSPSAVGRIQIRLRPRRQKCEAVSVRVVEYVPATAAPDQCTGWQVDMLTLLCGVKTGLNKIPVTEPST